MQQDAACELGVQARMVVLLRPSRHHVAEEEDLREQRYEIHMMLHEVIQLILPIVRAWRTLLKPIPKSSCGELRACCPPGAPS